jgi:hypothetical protein
MVHEAGETARTLIDRLGGNPLALAMVVMNLLLVGYLYYEGVNTNTQRSEELKLLYANRKDVAELLFKCVPPEALHKPEH